jgi:tetratricopeptide (TPR) repeat protein
MQLARRHHYLEELGVTLCGIGGLWFNHGNYAEAEQYLQEGLQIAQQFGQRENLCYVYNNLGCIAFSRGEADGWSPGLRSGATGTAGLNCLHLLRCSSFSDGLNEGMPLLSIVQLDPKSTKHR